VSLFQPHLRILHRGSSFPHSVLRPAQLSPLRHASHARVPSITLEAADKTLGRAQPHPITRPQPRPITRPRVNSNIEDIFMPMPVYSRPVLTCAWQIWSTRRAASTRMRRPTPQECKGRREEEARTAVPRARAAREGEERVVKRLRATRQRMATRPRGGSSRGPQEILGTGDKRGCNCVRACAHALLLLPLLLCVCVRACLGA
jgi:hypothetical protein